MKKDKKYKKISVTLNPEIIKKLEDGNFNMSKLIDSLLSVYFKSEEKKRD